MLIPREHQWIRTNGLSLHVLQAGPEDGPLTILLHGFPEFWYGWRYQIDALAGAGFRVWVPDQRGYNLSDKPARVEDYRMRELVADVVGLIDAAGVEQASIIGHDWGGNVAWWLAMLHRERVDKLGILGMPHPRILGRALRRNPRQMARSFYAGLFQLPMLPEAFIGFDEYRAFASLVASSARDDTFHEGEISEYRQAWSQPDAMASMLNWYRAYVRYAPAPPVDWQVHVPTLLLWGRRDTFFVSDLAQRSLDLCDSGRAVILKHASHWLHHEEYRRVNELLLEFLAQ